MFCMMGEGKIEEMENVKVSEGYKGELRR